jgi:hypothetical protein
MSDSIYSSRSTAKQPTSSTLIVPNFSSHQSYPVMKTVHILSLLCSAISPCAVAFTFPFPNHTLSERIFPYNCPPPPSAFAEAESRLLASQPAKDMSLLPAIVTIPTYVHVIAASKEPSGGFVNVRARCQPLKRMKADLLGHQHLSIDGGSQLQVCVLWLLFRIEGFGLYD